MHKKILHIRDSGGFFGGEQVILTILKNLNRNKYEPLLLYLDRGDGKSKRLVEVAALFNIHTIAVPCRRKFDLKTIKQIRHEIKNRNIGCIHTHDFKSDFYGLMATINTPVTRIATSHGSTKDSILLRSYLFLSEFVFYNFYDWIIAVSKQRKNDLFTNLIIRKKIILIENGIDTELFRLSQSNTDQEETTKLFSRSVNIAIIGRLYPDKGHAYLLQALPRVIEKFADLMLFIIGEGPSGNVLKQQVQESGLDNHVKFLGVRNDLYHFYQCLDLLVIPSLREGLPYVLLEALANNVPVVASRVGAIPDVIEHNHSGYLVEPMDVNGLANAVIDSLSDRRRAVQMTGNAYLKLQKYFSAEKMIQSVETLYEKSRA